MRGTPAATAPPTDRGRRRLRGAAALLAALLAACATGTPGDGATTFIVVRHAEKAADGSDDPGLSPAGHARAAALAELLADAPLHAVYATGFRRSRETAAPTARAHGLAITGYDAQAEAGSLVRHLRADHRGRSVLVVGHSNTVPGIVAALCGCDVEPMDESEYDRRTTIHIDPAGRVSVLTTPLPAGGSPATPSF